MTTFGAEYNPGLRGLGTYANPHHTIAMRDIPTQLKQVMRLCRWYYNQDSLLGAVVDKMSEYPITRILVNEIDGHQLTTQTRDKWEYLIGVTMNLRQAMIDINVDKQVYGSSFHYLYYPFVRYCVDPSGTRFPIATVNVRRVIPTTGPDGKFTFNVVGFAPGSNREQTFTIEDRKSESRSGFKFIRLSPLRMSLKYNPASGAREWMWTPPSRLKEGFQSKDRTVIDTTEMRVLEAAFKSRKIKMDPSRLWVAQAPTQPDLWEGWGIPPLFRVLEDVYYYKILRRANEALAQEHVTPMRFLSPRATGDVSPQRTVNLTDWQARLKKELQSFKSDPNHIAVSPIPVEIEQMGGQARVMMVAAEMEAAARTIASGVGCPVELIWGGLNWSGASVSLRILENHFINMREDCERLLDFIAPKLANYFALTPVKLTLAEFRMADDAQHQAQSINLMLQGFLDRESVLGEMGYDPDEVFNRLESEHERMNRITMKDNVASAHMQSIIAAMEAKANILLQYELQIAQQGIQIQSERERMRQLRDHVNKLHEQGITSPMEFDQSAQLLQRMDPNLQNLILQQWMQTMPTVTRLLMSKLGLDAQAFANAQQATGQVQGPDSMGAAENNGMQPGATGPYAEGQDPQQQQSEMPMPEQRPPRRDGLQ